MSVVVTVSEMLRAIMKMSSHAAHQGVLFHGHLSLLSHCGLILT